MGEQAGGERARFLGQPRPVPGCPFTCSLGAGRGRCHSCRGPLRAVVCCVLLFLRQSSATPGVTADACSSRGMSQELSPGLAWVARPQ